MNTASGDNIILLLVNNTYFAHLPSVNFSDKQWMQRRKTKLVRTVLVESSFVAYLFKYDVSTLLIIIIIIIIIIINING